MTPKRLWAACVLALALTLSLVGESAPAVFATLFAEDGWGEWATFLAFALAAGLAAHGAVRVRGRERLVLAGVGLFCLVVAGEEISWGQRLVAFAPPEVFLRANYQQELNVHNFFRGIFDTRWQVLLVALGYGIVWPLARWGTPPAPALMLPAAAVVGLELAYPFPLAGELAELLLGSLFLGDVVTRRSGARGLALGAALQLAVLAAAAGMAPLLDAVVYPARAERVAAARLEVSRLAEALQRDGALTQGGRRHRRLHKRMFTAHEAHQVELAPLAAEERARFFLDPWNQPYWLLFEKRGPDSGRVVVYSFGPNRRRDSRLKPLGDGDDALRGDDVGVAFPIRW
jgi:hypothetical protein